jgi:hypothetical protein
MPYRHFYFLLLTFYLARSAPYFLLGAQRFTFYLASPARLTLYLRAALALFDLFEDFLVDFDGVVAA